MIIDTFNNASSVDGLAEVVSSEDLEAKGYSFSAGQYFEVKIEYSDISQAEFAEKISAHRKVLNSYFSSAKGLEDAIQEGLGRLGLDLK